MYERRALISSGCSSKSEKNYIRSYKEVPFLLSTIGILMTIIPVVKMLIVMKNMVIVMVIQTIIEMLVVMKSVNDEDSTIDLNTVQPSCFSDLRYILYITNCTFKNSCFGFYFSLYLLLMYKDRSCKRSYSNRWPRVTSSSSSHPPSSLSTYLTLRYWLNHWTASSTQTIYFT